MLRCAYARLSSALSAHAFQYRAAQGLDQSWHRYPGDDLGGEGMGQQVARTCFAEPAAAPKEQRISLDLPDCRTVLAFHIVVEDLKLRLRVDTRLVREQQVAAALRGISGHRTFIDDDLAAENRMRRSVSDAFVQLDALASWCSMIDQGVRVGDLAPRDQGQPIEVYFCAFTLLCDMPGMSRHTGAPRNPRRRIITVSP